MKKKLNQILCATFCLYLLAACTQKQTEASSRLFPAVQWNEHTSDNVLLSEAIGNYRVIPLETNDSSLIDATWTTKYLKRNNKFYVSSNSEILKFSAEGKYLGKLSARGGGPEEYSSLASFDVPTIQGNEEIWVGADDKLVRYDAETFEFKGNIPTSGVVIGMRYIDEETILIFTSGDYLLGRYTLAGDMKEFLLEKDPSEDVRGVRHPFFTYKGRDYYQRNDTQSGFYYDTKTNKLCEVTFWPDENKVITPTLKQEYLKEFGYMKFTKELGKKYIEVTTILTQDDTVLAILSYPNREDALLLIKEGVTKIYPLSSIKNDIFQSESNRFLRTFFSCDSDDSFFCTVPANQFFADDVSHADNNAVILEFY